MPRVSLRHFSEPLPGISGVSPRSALSSRSSRPGLPAGSPSRRRPVLPTVRFRTCSPPGAGPKPPTAGARGSCRTTDAHPFPLLPDSDEGPAPAASAPAPPVLHRRAGKDRPTDADSDAETTLISHHPCFRQSRQILENGSASTISRKFAGRAAKPGSRARKTQVRHKPYPQFP